MKLGFSPRPQRPFSANSAVKRFFLVPNPKENPTFLNDTEEDGMKQTEITPA
jgi:hypothetical protein